MNNNSHIPADEAYKAPSSDVEGDPTRRVREIDLSDKGKRYKRKMDRKFKRNMGILRVMFFSIAPVHAIIGILFHNLSVAIDDSTFETTAIIYIMYGCAAVYALSGVLLKSSPVKMTYFAIGAFAVSVVVGLVLIPELLYLIRTYIYVICMALSLKYALKQSKIYQRGVEKYSRMLEKD